MGFGKINIWKKYVHVAANFISYLSDLKIKKITF